MEKMKFHAYPFTSYLTQERLSTLVDVYPAGMYVWDSQGMTGVAPKSPLPPSSLPAPQQDDELEVVGSNEDNSDEVVDIYSFNINAFECTDICIRVEQIQYV